MGPALHTDAAHKEGRERLVAFLEGTPGLIRTVAAGLTDEALRRKPAAGGFSALEHVCHLNDIEREAYAVRITRLLSEDDPFLPDVDGDKLARERNYNERNFAEMLCAFSEARGENLAVVQNLSAEQLRRRGTLENVGPVTLEGVLLKMIEHDESHREELSALCPRLRPKER